MILCWQYKQAEGAKPTWDYVLREDDTGTTGFCAKKWSCPWEQKGFSGDSGEELRQLCGCRRAFGENEGQGECGIEFQNICMRLDSCLCGLPPKPDQTPYSVAERNDFFETLANKPKKGQPAKQLQYDFASAVIKCWWLARCTCPSEGVVWPSTEVDEESDDE